MDEVSALGTVFIFYKTTPLENGRRSLKNGHDLYPFCGYLEWLED